MPGGGNQMITERLQLFWRRLRDDFLQIVPLFLCVHAAGRHLMTLPFDADGM